METLDMDKIDSEYFKLFFALSPDLFAISACDGYFQHLNNAWEGVLGYSTEELLKVPYLSLVHPEDYERTNAVHETLGENFNLQNFENRLRCKDGTYKNFSWNARRHSTRELVFAVARDITFQKSLEANLKHEKYEAELQAENIHMLLSQVPALAAVTKGPDHIFAFANSDCCALLGNRSPVGMAVADALPGLSEPVLHVLDHVYQTGEKYTAENMVMQADWSRTGTPSERCFTFIYSPLKDSRGQVYGIWCLAFDVTEVKVMQERLEVSEKMASLGTVAAGVAHEINNPLAYVSGLLDLATKQVDSISIESFEGEKTQLLERIKSCGSGLDRITKIVKSLKTFSRTDEETLEPINIGEVLQNTLQFADNEVKHRARVLFDVPSLPPCRGSQSKLTQVFLNLIINAAHAIPVGRVDENSITVSARILASDFAEISVTDTGCGIAPQNLAKIFEPFYTSKPFGEGTGLGLSICHGIITSMNGKIEVESKVGSGTTFKVILPLAQPALAPALAEKPLPLTPVKPQATPVPTAPKKANSVLVIDDEVALAEVIGLCLESDFDITVVNSVHDALIEIGNKRHFDVILCDLMMPYQTGMDLYFNLSRNHPGLQDRIIFMSGGVFTSESSDFLSKVRNQKISKPFSMTDVRDLILQAYRQQQETAA